MATGFRPRRRGRVVVGLTTFEADLVRSLAAQLVELLQSEGGVAKTETDPLETLVGLGEPTPTPEDPVLARLFPSAYPDDEEASADFRRFTQAQLRGRKVAAAATVLECLERAGHAPGGFGPPGDDEDGSDELEVELDQAQALAWLTSLNDMRLALATRLDVTHDDEDYWASLDDEDPRTQLHDIYEWLGFLQETLVRSLET